MIGLRNIYWLMIKENGNPNNIKYVKTNELEEEFLKLGLNMKDADNRLVLENENNAIKNKGIKKNINKKKPNSFTVTITVKGIITNKTLNSEYEALIFRKYLEFENGCFKKPSIRYNNDLKHPFDRTYKWEKLKKEIINSVLIRTTWIETKKCFKKGIFSRFPINYEDPFDIVENRIYRMCFYNYKEVPKDFCFYGNYSSYTSRDYKCVLKSRNILFNKFLPLNKMFELVINSNPISYKDRIYKKRYNLVIEELTTFWEDTELINIKDRIYKYRYNLVIKQLIKENEAILFKEYIDNLNKINEAYLLKEKEYIDNLIKDDSDDSLSESSIFSGDGGDGFNFSEDEGDVFEFPDSIYN